MKNITSPHLGEMLASLLDNDLYQPEDLKSVEVKAPLDGLEVQHLVSALANSVYSGNTRNPHQAAADWVKIHITK